LAEEKRLLILLNPARTGNGEGRTPDPSVRGGTNIKYRRWKNIREPAASNPDKFHAGNFQ